MPLWYQRHWLYSVGALKGIFKASIIPSPIDRRYFIPPWLGKAKYFTSLDLKSGYWQVLMDKRDKEKTAFACHRGLYEFNVMPFGLTSAPAVFQELTSIVLQGLDSFAIAYLDDILIYSSSWMNILIIYKLYLID